MKELRPYRTDVSGRFRRGFYRDVMSGLASGSPVPVTWSSFSFTGTVLPPRDLDEVSSDRRTVEDERKGRTGPTSCEDKAKRKNSLSLIVIKKVDGWSLRY